MSIEKHVLKEKQDNDNVHHDELYPSLRFPEFNDNWKQYKLGEITNRITRKNKNLETKLPLTISAKYGLIDQEKFFNKIVASKNLKNYYLIKKDEFAYNKSYSNDNPFGVIKQLRYYNKGALSTLYICFETKDNINPKFLSYYFETTKWHEEISKIAVEGARNHGLLNIVVQDFFNTTHKLPNSNKEQIKIASFLSKIDEKIMLLEEKLEQLKKFKKGLLNYIFNHENVKTKLRFDDFTSEWVHYKLGDICEIKKGFTPSTSNLEYWNGNLNWLSIADMNQGKYITKTSKKITKKGAKNREIIKKGTLLMSFKLSIGKLGILKEDMYTNEAICNFNWINDNISTEFMYYYLSSINIMKYGSQAAKGITLNNDTLKDIPINLPAYNEQNKITGFLSKIDEKIEIINKQLCNTKNFKDGLLQQMFI